MNGAPFRPLLGEPVQDVAALRLPLFGSRKYDGIRGLVMRSRDGGGFDLFTRKLKLVPAREVAAKFSIPQLHCCEGELVWGDPVAPNAMSMATSAVMSHNKPHLAKDVKLYVFDWFGRPDWPYEKRLAMAEKLVKQLKRPDVVLVAQTSIVTPGQLSRYEERIVREGYEGIMLRDAKAPYKNGRSSLDEQYLLKWKRFEDGEARIVAVQEGKSNQNEQTRDERGYSKRSKRAEGMVPNGTLGQLIVRDEKNFPGLTFAVGSGPGLTLEERARLWSIRTTLPGQWVTYRFQRVGTKDAPRFPRFVSLRDKRDFDR